MDNVVGDITRLGKWGALLIALVLVGCGGQQATSNTPRSTSANMIDLLQHSDRVVFGTPEAMCNVTLVADAVVGSSGQSHWNTGDGSRPRAATAADVETKGLTIYTPIHLVNLRALVDHRRGPTSEFVSFGGQVGSDWIQNQDFPSPSAGGRYVLLLVPGSTAYSTAYSQTTLLVYDAFPITSSGDVVLQAQRVEQGQISQHEVRMPLNQLSQRLAACR
jgi:hypothetical protein